MAATLFTALFFVIIGGATMIGIYLLEKGGKI